MTKSVVLGFSSMFMGIFLAIVVQQLHQKGIFIDEITTIHTTISVSDLMFITFLPFVLIGLFFILVSHND